MNFLDLFSGIGGFSLGFERAGYKFDYHGFSEIDKYATEVYKRRFKNAKELGSITDIQPERDLPDHIDILCGGFPCQSFSMAGQRGGFNDTRGTLFFEIARILRYFKDVGEPISYFVLENVKGLLNHDNGRTFTIIYRALTDLDYTVECQLLNTRWFLPQNRERIYIIGHFRGEPKPKVFPIGEEYQNDHGKDRKQISSTITSSYCRGWGGGRELIADYRTDEGIRIRNDGDAPCLTASHNSENEPSRMQGLVIKSAAIRGRDDNSAGNLEARKDDVANAILTDTTSSMVISHNLQQRSPNRPSKLEGQSGGSGHLSKGDGTTYCLDTGNTQAVELSKSNIRRLTPKECSRLQGFPDDWNDCQSDTQRYKQLGNAVSVPVVEEIAKRLKDCL